MIISVPNNAFELNCCVVVVVVVVGFHSHTDPSICCFRRYTHAVVGDVSIVVFSENWSLLEQAIVHFAAKSFTSPQNETITF